MGKYDYIAMNETLRPGDIVAVEFDMMQMNDAMAQLAVTDIKAALWAEPMLDYQSGRVLETYDTQTQRLATRVLRIVVSIRDKPKADRNENPTGIVTATLNSIQGIVVNAAGAWAGSLYDSYAYVMDRTGELLSDAAGTVGGAVVDAATSPVGLTIGVGLAVLWIIVNAQPRRS